MIRHHTRQDPTQWHRWYAWYPVRIEQDREAGQLRWTTVWREWVWRRGHYGWDGRSWVYYFGESK